MKKGEISRQRQQRLREVVMPLMVQGHGCRKIAHITGMPHRTAADDVRLVKEMWEQIDQQERDQWRGRITATYDWMLTELAEQWQTSKTSRETKVLNPDGTMMIRQEPPDPRWMSGMLAVAKEASTYLGLREGADQVNRIEVPEQTRAALAPMGTDQYMAMLAQQGGSLPGVNAVPPVTERRALEVIDVAPEVVHPVVDDEESPPADGDRRGWGTVRIR